MAQKTQLITVPTFQFIQGDFFGSDNNIERPIQVSYYDNCIQLEQGGNEIIILPDMLNDLFKEIKRHLPELIEEFRKVNIPRRPD